MRELFDTSKISAFVYFGEGDDFPMFKEWATDIFSKIQLFGGAAALYKGHNIRQHLRKLVRDKNIEWNAENEIITGDRLQICMRDELKG